MLGFRSALRGVCPCCGDTDALAHEAADIVSHLLVLLSMEDLELADLRAELHERR